MAKSWDNSNYPMRREIAIEQGEITGNHTSFPTLIELVDGAAIVNADIVSKRYQLYDGDGTELPYDEVSYAQGGTYTNFETFVVVDLYVGATGNQNKVWLYYGYDPGSNQDNPGATWDVGFLGVYHLGSDPALDSSGNGNDMTTTGSTGSATGVVGNARNFNNDRMVVAVNNPDPFTVSMWFKVERSVQEVMGSWSSVASARSVFVIDNGDDIGYWDSINSWTRSGDTPPNIDPQIGTWYHYVIVVKSNDYIKLYVDGALAEEDTSIGSIPSTTHLVIGSEYPNSQTQGFRGDIDEFRASNVERSAEWIKFEYANMNSADREQVWGGEETESPWSDDFSHEAAPLRDHANWGYHGTPTASAAGGTLAMPNSGNEHLYYTPTPGLSANQFSEIAIDSAQADARRGGLAVRMATDSYSCYFVSWNNGDLTPSLRITTVFKVDADGAGRDLIGDVTGPINVPLAGQIARLEVRGTDPPLLMFYVRDMGEDAPGRLILDVLDTSPTAVLTDGRIGIARALNLGEFVDADNWAGGNTHALPAAFAHHYRQMAGV